MLVLIRTDQRKHLNKGRKLLEEISQHHQPADIN